MMGWAIKWSDAKIGQNTFGGWSPEALTKFSNITKAITKARTMKRTKIADKWLLKAICDRYKYVEKGKKRKKVKISAPKAHAAEVVIVPFDCEKDTEVEAEDVDLTILGIDLLDIESEHGLVDSDDSDNESKNEDQTDPTSGGNPPQ